MVPITLTSCCVSEQMFFLNSAVRFNSVPQPSWYLASYATVFCCLCAAKGLTVVGVALSAPAASAPTSLVLLQSVEKLPALETDL